MERVEAQRQVEAFARARPSAILYDATAGHLLDVFSGNTLALDWRQIREVAERSNQETGAPYLVLVREDGAQIVHADVGVAFAPIASHPELAPDLPPVVCFRDLAHATAQLTHFLLDHPDDPPRREHIAWVLFCLALIEGARAVGFEVSREERQVEKLLGEIEARGRPQS
jgi:hypothetical protein